MDRGGQRAGKDAKSLAISLSQAYWHFHWGLPVSALQ